MTKVSFYTPENIKQCLVFGCFQEVRKETSGMKWVNNEIFDFCPELVFSNWLIVFLHVEAK